MPAAYTAITGSSLLATMPSVLAICDLRRRIRRHLGRQRIGEDELVALLVLDPPAVLRGLRAATSPVYGPTTERWTVRRLVKALGPALSQRLALTPERGMSGTAPLRRLWMRSIGIASAARILAMHHGTLDADEAYLFGLLRTTPDWIDQLSRLQTGQATTPADARSYTLHWRLGGELAAAAQVGVETACDPEIRELLTRAERIADLAGFGQVDSARRSAATKGTAEIDVEALAHLDETRSLVEDGLRRVGLDFALPDLDSEFGESTIDADVPAFNLRSRPALDDMALTLLSCSGARTYRGIITALTAAAVRHGGYDRAFYAKWCRRRGRLVLRAKSDLSSRRLHTPYVQPTEPEAELMRAALLGARPTRFERDPATEDGVLALLGVDEALLVPLNDDFESPSFLVLDRSLSHDPIRPVADADTATAMSLTGSLLVENLLLRKRRDRAQKFASTDGLTRLLNRTMGLHCLDQEIARATRTDNQVGVLLCDLDYFKQLNDSYGHLQGDNALRATADVLRQTARRSDSVSRYGGEEFLVVLPETSAEEASVFAARLHIAVEQRGKELGLPLTISIGLASSRHGDTWETVLHRADQALYASKDHGRNRFSADPADLDLEDNDPENSHDGELEPANAANDSGDPPAAGPSTAGPGPAESSPERD
ncbi:MAG: GGDEF domain-containing protein [bacterium]|nr:GGDEF domain-containing protein [bacterium]